MKKVIITFLFLIAFLTLTGCTTQDLTDDTSDYKYLTLTINPKIDFVVNSEDEVDAVIPENEDAEVVASELDMVGMDIEDAIDAYIEAVTETGYIDPEEVDNEVAVEVTGEDEEDASDFNTAICDRINNYFKANGVFGNASAETIDEYLDKAIEMSINTEGLSLGKVKAIVIAMEKNPDLDIEELRDMTVGDIIKLISDDNKTNGVNAALYEEFALAKEEVRAKYAHMFELREQIATLEGQIAEFTGTEEELAALNAQLTALYDEFTPLKEAYDAEIAALRDSYRELSEAAREEQKALRQARVAEHKGKLTEAKANAKANRNIAKEIAKRQAGEEFDPFVGDESASGSFVSEAKTIRSKYANMFQLKVQVATLQKQLKNFEGTDEEKALLEQECLEKQNEYDSLKKQYYTELSDLAKKVRAAKGKSGETGNTNSGKNGNSN